MDPVCKNPNAPELYRVCFYVLREHLETDSTALNYDDADYKVLNL